jgi:hypothetical protein
MRFAGGADRADRPPGSSEAAAEAPGEDAADVRWLARLGSAMPLTGLRRVPFEVPGADDDDAD